MEKIENLSITWTLDNLCNYDCPYCPIPSPEKKEGVKAMNKEKLKLFFNRIHNSNIILSGGEPFLIPDFLEICQLLINNKNKIYIYTNLSSDLVYEFAEKFTPGDIIYIRATLHINEIKKFNSKNKFIERYNYLIKKGFHVEVPIVMWPPIFKNFEKIYKEFVSYGIYLIPLSFFGKYKEKDYPESYTKKELKTIKKYFEKTNKDFKDNYSNPTEILKTKVSYKGRPCLTGIKSFIINPHGNISRCYSDHNSLGNIYSDNKINLFKEIKPCKANYCVCPMEGYNYCLDKKNMNFYSKKNDNILIRLVSRLLK
ncbi:MAG: radical SAM protein [Candidatus Pacearchaeota archaeon]|jgi:MoaA/NifB/PqqE/SkfB family radical SAM enzyme